MTKEDEETEAKVGNVGVVNEGHEEIEGKY